MILGPPPTIAELAEELLGGTGRQAHADDDDAALVALQPGGLLIFETPNPTNVNVGASSFYLDPTHLKPLHPQFLGATLTHDRHTIEA